MLGPCPGTVDCAVAGLPRAGDGDEFLAALREFDRRLRVYPQFGDPLADLGHDGGTVRIGIIRPLSVRYALIESQRLVLLAAMPVLMPIRGS